MSKNDGGPIIKEEKCTYCGVNYPAPISYHHDEDECAENIQFAKFAVQKWNELYNGPPSETFIVDYAVAIKEETEKVYLSERAK